MTTPDLLTLMPDAQAATAYEVTMLCTDGTSGAQIQGMVVCGGFDEAATVALQHFATPVNLPTKRVMQVRKLDCPCFVTKSPKPN